MIPTVTLDQRRSLRFTRFGLGCGQLVGRFTLRESRRIVETALELGIRHFDTAPSYGMGTSEEVLGEVLAGIPDVTVATKVGPARGRYSARVNVVRKLVKPTLDRLGALKRLARRSYAPPTSTAANRPRYDFSRDRIRRELDASLKLLRRPNVDLYLAHEPHPDDLTPDFARILDELVSNGLVRSWGVGIGARSAPWSRCGRVWQSGWTSGAHEYPADLGYFFHGVLRQAERDGRGRLVSPPAQLLRSAALARPDCVFLVSAANPARLRELFSG